MLLIPCVKNIVVFPLRSTFTEKLIYCITFGSTSSTYFYLRLLQSDDTSF